MSLSKSTRLNLIGIIILLVGCGTGLFLYSIPDPSQNNIPSDANGPLSLQDSRKDSRQVEMNVGKVGLLINRMQNALGEWVKPAPLGIAIMSISVLSAFYAFWRADVKPGK